MDLNREHIEILRHTASRAAGGLYCGDSPEMRELVDAGLMKCVGHKAFVPDPYYGLTVEGRQALNSIPAA